MIEHPIGPSVGTGQVLTTAGANSVPTTDLGRVQHYMIWSANDFYHFLAANNTPVAGAATMPRLRAGVVYVFRTEPGKTFAHAADPAAGAINVYVTPIGAGS